MRRSKHGFDWHEAQEDFDFFDEDEYLERESTAASARQRSGSVAQSRNSDVSSSDISKQMAARRADRSMSFDVPTAGAHVTRPRSQTVATEKPKLGVWGGQLTKKVVDRITPLSEEVLCKLAEFLTPFALSRLCVASKKLEKKLTAKNYWRNQLHAHDVHPHVLWTNANEEKVARKCLQYLLSYGSRLPNLQHAAVNERHSTPTVVKLLPLPTPHAVAAFKETGEVSVWNLQAPGRVSERWSYLTANCETVAVSENGRLVVQSTKSSSIVTIDLGDLFTDEVVCEPVTYDVGVLATAVAVQAVDNDIRQLPEWIALVGHDTASNGDGASQGRATLEIIDALNGDCKSRYHLPPQTYFAYSPFVMTALKHKLVMCFHDGRVCVYSVSSSSSQQVDSQSPPIHSFLSGSGNRITDMHKLTGNRGYVAATHHAQLIRCAFAPAADGQADLAKVASVSDPPKVSQGIIPAITALKATDTTVVCARQGSEVTLEAFDLRRMAPLFAFKKDKFKGVLDVDFDELKLVVLLEDFSAEILFWHQINSEQNHRVRNTICSASCSVPRYIPTHETKYLNSGALATTDEKFIKVVLGKNLIILTTTDGFRVIWERTKQQLEEENKSGDDGSDSEGSEDSVDEAELRRQQKKREKLEARRKHESSRKSKHKQMDAARRQKYG